MESIYNNLEDYIMSAENIFDIYIHIYSILKQHLSDFKKSLEIDYEEDIGWKKELINLHDEKDFDIEISEEYKCKILEIIPKKNKYKLLSFLKLLFEEIDEIAGDGYYLTSKSYIQEDDGRNIKLDFLNTKTSLEIGQVFYKQKNLFADIMNPEDKFSLEKDVGETVEIYQTNLLVKEKMVSDTKINLFRVTDRYINRKLKKKNNNFKIALIPFSCDKNIIDVDTIKLKGVDHITIKGINQEDKYIKLVENILEELIRH